PGQSLACPSRCHSKDRAQLIRPSGYMLPSAHGGRGGMMAYHRGFHSILAMAVLTTGLAGCTNLNGLFTVPGGTSAHDGLKPDNGGVTPGEITNPGDQLLSNSAATAISDVVATFRDVGALKHMASQQPLLSNAGGSLLSNA